MILHAFTLKATPVGADELYLASAADSYAERRATITSLFTNPTFIAPVLGAATATSLATSGAVTAATFNGLTLTSSTGTLTLANGKTLTVSNTITLAGTDGTTMTFPAVNATLASLAGAESLSNKTLVSPVITGTLSVPSLATSGATPLVMTNAQVVSVVLSSQTVGSVTLTIPNFADVDDEFVFKTKAVALSNKTFIAPVLGAATASSMAVAGPITATTATGGITSSSPSAGIGYATGAGSAVTQTGSRTAPVTINAVCGAITLVSVAGTATYRTFTVNNSTVAATDVPVVVQKSGTDLNAIYVSNIVAGSFSITIYDLTGTTAESPVLNFIIHKAVAA